MYACMCAFKEQLPSIVVDTYIFVCSNKSICMPLMPFKILFGCTYIHTYVCTWFLLMLFQCVAIYLQFTLAIHRIKFPTIDSNRNFPLVKSISQVTFTICVYEKYKKDHYSIVRGAIWISILSYIEFLTQDFLLTLHFIMIFINHFPKIIVLKLLFVNFSNY